MSEIKIKLDDNKDLISSLVKRTKLLERLIAKKEKGLKAGDVVKIMAKSRKQEVKSFNRTVSSLSSAMGKIKPPKINITQKDNSSVLVKSLNKRISLLETLLKKVKKPKVVTKVVRVKPEIKVVENNVILESIRSKDLGMSVIPSPS